jgi:imidazolonepropionase-like amidohydrolase
MKVPRLLALAIVAMIGVPNPAAGDVTIIHAGWLLASPGKPPVERRSIVVENGRVTAVREGFMDRPDSGVDGPAIRIVDLSQAFVLPGLIDSHVHLASAPGAADFGSALSRTEADIALTASRHAQQTLQSGFTTVVDLGAVGIPGHENAIFGVRDAVNSGKLAGPRILSAGTPIAATGLARASSYRDDIAAGIDMRSVCDGANDCRRAVRHQVKRGSDIIVFFNTGSLLASQPVAQTMTLEEMRAVVETAHSLGRKVIADGHHAAGIAAAVEAGADIIDSAHLYDDSTFSLLGKDVFLQSHIYGVVMAVGDTHATLHDGLWGWLPDPLLVRFQQIRMRPFAMTAAYEAGVRNLAYASDAGVYEWGNNAADFREFVKRGMTHSDAIMTATVNAARMLGLEDDLGAIEPGKRADIIAANGNPLHDISALMNIRFVMRDGVVYRSDDRDMVSIGATVAESSP